MATAMLASNGYRIAKSWQYQAKFPDPPIGQPPTVPEETISRQSSVQLSDRVEKRPLLESSPLKSNTEREVRVSNCDG